MPDAGLIKEMMKAAKAGNVTRVNALLAEDPSLVQATDGDGCTPLHYACWKGHTELAAVLLDSGAEVNVHSNNGHWGTTPLHAAAHGNRGAIVELLLARGADADARDMNGKTPLDHTTFHKATTAARMLERHRQA